MEQVEHQEKLDYAFLRRELDRCKSSILMDAKNAFLGALMCQLKQDWDESIPTACTNGKSIWWSPRWFLSLPKPARVTVQAHEVWHVARLHMIRRGNRDPRIWNYACMPGDSLIAMADGSSKPIAQMLPGDLIKNVKDGISSVAVRINSGTKGILEFTYESGRILKCTPDHQVLTTDGFRNASQLTTGTSCFVDTRFNQDSKGALGNQTNTRNSGCTRHEVSTSGSESLHNRADQISETLVTNPTYADSKRAGMGLLSGSDRWGGDNYHYPKNDKGETIPSTENACNKHLPTDAGLVGTTGVWLDTSGEQQRLLVLHDAHSSDSFDRVIGKAAAMVSNQAALSNLRASMDGSTESASIQVFLDARDGKDSRGHLYLEYDRIIQIRQLPAEETFDLVTSDHHFIANGVVVHNCDIRINNDLKAMGFSFVGLEDAWMDNKYPPEMPEEDIYEDLIKNAVQPPPMNPFDGDLGSEPGDPGDGSGGGKDNAPGPYNSGPPDKKAAVEQLQAVAQAIQQAKLQKQAGSIPGQLELIVDEFLSPVIPWEQVLFNWFTDLITEDYSWRRPNRRYQDMYLPSLQSDEQRLTCLHYYFDISGSVTDQMIQRFNSEVKYIKDTFNPEKLVLVMFDTEIHEVYEISESDVFDRIKVTGRGGTCLKCVHAHIEETKPTAAIIFTDLECSPMQPLKVPVPIIWTVADNPYAEVPFGQIIHIKE